MPSVKAGNKHKGHRSGVSAGKYAAQFIRTDRNKARRAVKRQKHKGQRQRMIDAAFDLTFDKTITVRELSEAQGCLQSTADSRLRTLVSTGRLVREYGPHGFEYRRTARKEAR